MFEVDNVFEQICILFSVTRWVNVNNTKMSSVQTMQLKKFQFQNALLKSYGSLDTCTKYEQ